MSEATTTITAAKKGIALKTFAKVDVGVGATKIRPV